MAITHTRWPVFAALVLGLSTIAVFWYVILSNPTGEAVPASGGSYTEGVIRPPERINPLFARANATDADLSALIFSGLVRLGPDGTPQPDLAERWEITSNGQRYVFHLRHGVVWHDRDPFDAEDVVFTFRSIADPAFKGDPALAQLVDGVVVDARDPYTVEFRLEQAYAPFLAYLTVGMLPEHLLQGLDANELYNAPFNAQPVGTGPYSFARRGETSVQLDSSSTYYFGPPRISTLEFRVFPSEDTLADALRERAIDGALLSPEASADDIDFLRGERRYALYEMATTSYFAIFFDTRSPVFSEPDVRRALLQGINRDLLIDAVAVGRGEIANATGIPLDLWAYVPIDEPAFDPGKAAADLERAGWGRARDGVRAKGGTRLAFDLSVPDDPRRVAIAENVVRQWRLVGAEVTVRRIDASTYIDQELLPRKYQAALVAVDPGPDPDPYGFWHSSQVVPPGRNLSNYVDSRIDDTLERARQTTDADRRRELYALFAGYLVAGTPSVPLYTPTYTYVQEDRVRGFEPGLLFAPASRFANVNEWFVETRVE